MKETQYPPQRYTRMTHNPPSPSSFPDSRPQTPDPRPQTPDPRPQTLDPRPQKKSMGESRQQEGKKGLSSDRSLSPLYFFLKKKKITAGQYICIKKVSKWRGEKGTEEWGEGRALHILIFSSFSLFAFYIIYIYTRERKMKE